MDAVKKSRLSYGNRELLLTGFLRHYSGEIFLPCFVSEICSRFWYLGGAYLWRLGSTSMTHFRCSKKQTVMKTQIFQVNRTEIKCVVVQKSEGSYLYLKTDFNEHRLKTYFEIYCKETQCEHRGIKTFGRSDLVCMNLGSIHHYKSMCYMIYFDPNWYNIKTKMHTRYKYNWNLTKSQLENIQSGKCVLSDNFDADHWYLKCKADEQRGCCLYLVLLAIRSKKIYEMEVEYTLEANYDDIHVEMFKTFYAQNTESDTWSSNTLPWKVLQSLQQLTFTVTIEILSIYSDLGKKLELSQYFIS